MEHKSFRADNIENFNYCPYCGSVLETEQYPVRWTHSGEPVKYNTRKVCPEHGALY